MNLNCAKKTALLLAFSLWAPGLMAQNLTPLPSPTPVPSHAATPTPTPTPITPLPYGSVKVSCSIGFMGSNLSRLYAFPNGRTCSVGVTFNINGGLTDRVASCVVKAGTSSCSTVLYPPYSTANPVSAWVTPLIVTDEETVAGCIPAKNYPTARIYSSSYSGYTVSVIHRYYCPAVVN